MEPDERRVHLDPRLSARQGHAVAVGQRGADLDVGQDPDGEGPFGDSNHKISVRLRLRNQANTMRKPSKAMLFEWFLVVLKRPIGTSSALTTSARWSASPASGQPSRNGSPHTMNVFV